MAQGTRFERPEVGLVMEETPVGTRVSQGGRTYLARKWKLTPEVVGVVETALEFGLSCVWQDGHPGGDESHHISFSFSREKASWVFVIGAEAGPPALKKVTFHKRLKEYFKSAGLGWMWNWETAGGKNILVAPGDLRSVLETLPLDDIRAGRLPMPAPSARRGARADCFASERQLDDALFALGMEKKGASVDLQRKRHFPSNSSFEVASTPDLMAVAPQQALVIEIKLYEGGEAELAQLCRYLGNRALRLDMEPRRIHGVLIAERFQPNALALARQRPDVTLVRYSQSSAGQLTLKVEQGEDVLGGVFG